MPARHGPATFIIAVNNDSVFENNFLASPCLKDSGLLQIIPLRDCHSAPVAYNEGIRRAHNEIIIFAHQDLFLPETWMEDLYRSVACIEKFDPAWGVLGCYGIGGDGRSRGHLYTTGWEIVGEPLGRPERVRTLDEILLVIRRSSGLIFDESLPHFHLYGTDICLAAAERNMRCYAVPAFCIHNTAQILFMPKEFYSCCRYIRKKWKKSLPIQTSCIRITRWNGQIYERKIREMYARLFHRDRFPKQRMENPAEYWKAVKEGVKR